MRFTPVFNPDIAMAAVPSSLFDLPLSAAYDSARWSKAALDVWTGSLASSAVIATQREQRLVALVAHARIDGRSDPWGALTETA